MFYYEHTVTGKMDLQKVWALYSDVNRWQEWDTEIQKMELNGDFVTGSSGVMYMNGLPPLPFTLDIVEKNKKFIDSTTLEKFNIQVGHFITDEGNNKLTLKHSVTVTGASQEELETIGQNIVADLPESMEKLYSLVRID